MQKARGVLGCVLVMALGSALGCGDDEDKKNGGAASEAGVDSGPNQKPVDGGSDAKQAEPRDAGRDADRDAAESDADAAPDAEQDASVDAGMTTPLGKNPLALTFSGEGMGIDVRRAVNVSMEDTGRLLSYQVVLPNGDIATQEAPSFEELSAHEIFLDEFVAIGRLSDGATGGWFFPLEPVFEKHEGYHYAVGRRTETIASSGTTSYKLLASTKPTLKGGSVSPGATTGELNVAWNGETTRLGFDLEVTLDGEKYALTTDSGTNFPGDSQVEVYDGTSFKGQISLPKQGKACLGADTGCGAFLAGFFVGDDAERAVVTFIISGTGSNGDGSHGALVFQQD